MVRELTTELRREGLASEFTDVELLAWRLDTRGNRDRREVALIWGRTGAARTASRWVLVQGFRHPNDDDTWHRSLYFRDRGSPLTQLRPGETPDGTWHAFQHYDHAPTVREICDFGAVDFFNADNIDGYRRVEGEFRKGAWLRVADEAPRCGFAK